MGALAKTILKYAAFLAAAMVFEWWLLYLSPLNIPEFIPRTPIKINGLLLVGTTVIILIIALKKILKEEPGTNIFKLTVLGSVICFIAEVIFQSIQLSTIHSDKLYTFLHGVVGVTIFDIIISFFVAFQTKTGKTGQLLVFIVIFVAVLKVLLWAFPGLH